jgi:hypothetical protein
MKKWMYVIFPGLMLAGFLVIWATHKKEVEEREAQRIVANQKKAEEESAKKKEAEARAAEDARKRQAEHEKEEADKEAKRIAKQAEEDKKVKDATDEALGRIDKFGKQASQLEIELDALRKQKETLSRQTFDMARRVELARIAKRNAELEEQRMTAMIQQRANQSLLTQPPPPPPPPK